MRARKKKTNRKLLLAVPVVWSVMTTMQAVAAADDAGDAGADSGTPQRQSGICSVAPTTGAFGTNFGAGCC